MPENLDELADAELAKLVFDQNRSAEAAIVRRFGKGIRMILENRLGDRSLAEDLQQETFIVLIKRLRSQPLDNPEQLANFTHRIAVNLARAENRKTTRRGTESDTELVERIDSAAPGPENLVSSDLQSKAVHKLLNELAKNRDREILMGYYVQELDKSEICTKLGLSDRHFDRVLYRAKERFRQIVSSSFLAPAETTTRFKTDEV